MDSLSYFRRNTSKPKRNFLKENKRQVKKLEEQFRETHIDEPRAPLRSQKYANVQPKIQTQTVRRPASAYAAPSTRTDSTGSRRAASAAVSTCDEAVQCCEEAKILRSQGTQTDDKGVHQGKELSASAGSWEQRSELRLNLAEGPEPTQRTSSSGDKLVRWDLSSDSGLKESAKGGCDQGSVVFSDNERLQTLDQLRTAQEKLLAELNRLPVRSNTLRVQNKRREIDSQLDKIESMIKTFSRPQRSQSSSR
ncbi:Hypothetical predicted protein [Cloeon dipterum]|uniref:Enkurin domain-containing protein n=1 Tax=Cloeon dipterum TaxID=197152 RepID=A0A8S1D4R5_9INSE|nr:Hypothetical predicted protein [Cloeon dipterum]